MREYGLAFSLGFACACSQSLRDNGIQTASFPFDWTVTTGLSASVEMLENDFGGWFERADLKLWDVRIAGGHVSRVYRSGRNGFVFAHDFTNAEPIETHYDAAKARYDRRISRLMNGIRAAKRVLAVYVEHPANGRLADSDLVAARDRLAAKFPEAQVDLLYFYEDPDCRAFEATEAAAGVTVVRAEYRTYHDGAIMHVCNVTMIRDYLRENVSVPDTRTEEERRAFAARKRAERLNRFGGPGLGGLVNRKLHRLYRNIEIYLESQHLVPGDRPLRCDGDGK